MSKRMRLEPPIEMDTPMGRALAFFRTDYTATGNVVWECVIKKTGAFWNFENPLVLHAPCATFGIRVDELKAREERSEAQRLTDLVKKEPNWFSSTWTWADGLLHYGPEPPFGVTSDWEFDSAMASMRPKTGTRYHQDKSGKWWFDQVGHQ